MSSGLFDNVYNPDVLSCLANLSNDEVFTPPETVNQMLDMLPQELFCNPDTTFLDPACKTGVFLREIAKRLIVGLEPQFPDLQERLDHIFHKQLFGIAITELTSLLSRRGVYCSKFPNSEFSVTRFESPEGNIRYRRIQHVWKDGRCVFCGASRQQYDRDAILETHAYEIIHANEPEEIFGMKFDVIIGNPPYQLSTGGTTAQATPLYDKFVQQAKKLKPRYLTMIIPSRWFAGGMGLDTFRESMLTDRRIRHITDYPNAKECFPGVSLGGGVCFFLWDRDHEGECEFTNVCNGNSTTLMRKLDEFPVFVRYNEAISIIHKVQGTKEESISSIVSALSPYGLGSAERGNSERGHDDVTLYSSKGKGYYPKELLKQGREYLDRYHIMMSKVTSEHAGEPSKDGTFKVISKMQVLKPNEICTFSYFLVGDFDTEATAQNCLGYLATKFARFLLLQAVSSINISKDKFRFVPMQDFTEKWTDEKLYKKYGLSTEEQLFIENMIRDYGLEV